MARSGLDPLTITALAVLVAIASLILGQRLSRARTRYWSLGWAASLLLIFSIGATHRWCELAFIAPFSWVGSGRSQFVTFSGAATLLLATLAPKLPHRRQRIWVFAFLGFCVSIFGFAPLVLPVLLRSHHESLETQFFKGGVCKQPDSYNCGPAAAVTALGWLGWLGWLGFEAKLGDLAIRALTTPLTGTPPDLLLHALEERYGAEGLTCERRRFKSVREIPKNGVTIVVVKLSFLIDHYVAVKELTENEVVIGDPLIGIVRLSPEELERRWRNTGIVLTRRE